MVSRGLGGQRPKPSLFTPNRLFYDLTTPQLGLNNKEHTSKSLFISSLTDTSPETYAQLIRGHWGIEIGLHWHLDLTFKEDASKVRKNNGPINLNIFRKFELFLLACEPSKMSLKRKRKKAARDDNFMLEILKTA